MCLQDNVPSDGVFGVGVFEVPNQFREFGGFPAGSVPKVRVVSVEPFLKFSIGTSIVYFLFRLSGYSGRIDKAGSLAISSQWAGRWVPTVASNYFVLLLWIQHGGIVAFDQGFHVGHAAVADFYLTAVEQASIPVPSRKMHKAPRMA